MAEGRFSRGEFLINSPWVTDSPFYPFFLSFISFILAVSLSFVNFPVAFYSLVLTRAPFFLSSLRN